MALGSQLSLSLGAAMKQLPGIGLASPESSVLFRACRCAAPVSLNAHHHHHHLFPLGPFNDASSMLPHPLPLSHSPFASSCKLREAFPFLDSWGPSALTLASGQSGWQSAVCQCGMCSCSDLCAHQPAGIPTFWVPPSDLGALPFTHSPKCQ